LDTFPSDLPIQWDYNDRRWVSIRESKGD